MLIALNDGIDTLKGEDDFTSFRNVMHEFYAKDTNKKIKSVFKAKGMTGKRVTGTVAYGYLWADEMRSRKTPQTCRWRQTNEKETDTREVSVSLLY